MPDEDSKPAGWTRTSIPSQYSNSPDHVELENLVARRLVAGEVASIILGRDGRLALLPATKGGGGCPSSF